MSRVGTHDAGLFERRDRNLLDKLKAAQRAPSMRLLEFLDSSMRRVTRTDVRLAFFVDVSSIVLLRVSFQNHSRILQMIDGSLPAVLLFVKVEALSSWIHPIARVVSSLRYALEAAPLLLPTR